jgi:hypothetical protein
MGPSCLKSPLALVRLSGVILLISLFSLAAGTAGSSPGTAALRLLSAEEMASTVGDAPGQFCLGTFTCRSQFEESSRCAYCDTTGNRLLCCPVSSGGAACTYTGKVACAGKRYSTAMYVTASCMSCTGGPFQLDGDCNDLKNAVCSINCK